MKFPISTVFVAFLFLYFPSKSSAQSISLSLVSSGFTLPTSLTAPKDGSGRLFVLEQCGKVRVIKGGVVLTDPFLDLTSLVTTSTEQGLLSLAFHPSFSTNRRFYVNYTDSQGRINIDEYLSSLVNPDVADITTRRSVLVIDHPSSIVHFGGQLQFGPDGLLYIGVGDGGPQGDPKRQGQSKKTFLGKILRIDVDSAIPYGIPEKNPFAKSSKAKHEIYALGFRNPWRFSFDRQTGRLYVGDVGYSAEEEVDLVKRGGNYGWSLMEGKRCFRPRRDCFKKGISLPLNTYTHALGTAVIGGYVYRGLSSPSLQGLYIFGDYSSGRIWSLKKEGKVWKRKQLLKSGTFITSFGEDESGEVYLVSYSGEIYRIVGG